MTHCKVSVIVPVYCAEQYLDRCVKSILSQTERDLELWLIDDGSPDQSGKICDKFAQEDARVHVIHKVNAGVSAARNDGIRSATGEYIAFVDADDYLEADMISGLLSIAEQQHCDVAVCGYYNESTKAIKEEKLCIGDGTYKENDTKQLFMKFFGRDYTGLPSMCNKLYRRSFLEKYEILLDERLQRAEDFWFNFDVFRYASCVSICAQPLYHYIQNEAGAMHVFRSTQFEAWTENRKRLLSYANEYGIALDFCDFYYKYVYNTVLFLRDLLQNKSKEKAYSIMREPFLRQAITQTGGFPAHVSAIVFCIRHGFYHFAGMILRFWAARPGE